jgi:mono/diheme cytochrome c family protein
MAGPSRLPYIRLGLMVAAIMTATPALSADANNGERLAHRWCEACHLVSASQRSATDQVPPFGSIAKMPGFDAAKIALFLLDPHPKMPNMGLSRTEAADLAAYIVTLK